MANSFSPWYVGQTSPAWAIPLNTDSGSDTLVSGQLPYFKMTFHNLGVAPPVDTVGTGTFAIVNLGPSPAASITYHPSPADVALPFSGTLIISCYVLPSYTSADNEVWDPIPFVITAI